MAACPKCGQQLSDDMLVCPSCRALVHGNLFEQLSSQGDRFERKSQFAAARETWAKALRLVPPDSEHAQWIRQHTEQLQNQAAQTGGPRKGKWAKRLGPLGPLAAVLAKAKSLLLLLAKFKFLFSLAAFIGLYWALWGPKFGIGFAAMILIHEMGHFIDVKRRGLPAEMPVFLPGLGAYVKWQALGVSPETRAAVSLAGPFAGWVASAICLVIWWKTGGPMWAALAHIGAWLNVLNLIPVWILDGSSAAIALSRVERALLAAVGVALWLIVGDIVFFLLACGAVYRVFTRDAPAESSKFIAAYYLVVLVCLGAVLHTVPASMLPTR
jgi:Zn-dependent protease